MKTIIWTAALTATIEVATVFFRFGLKMQSTRDTASTIGKLTFGIRVHHGYVGIALILAHFTFRSDSRNSAWLLIVGLSMFLSDMIHHFLVLWPLAGSPEFDFFYPEKIDETS